MTDWPLFRTLATGRPLYRDDCDSSPPRLRRFARNDSRSELCQLPQHVNCPRVVHDRADLQPHRKPTALLIAVRERADWVIRTRRDARPRTADETGHAGG